MKDETSNTPILPLGVCEAVYTVWSLDLDPSMTKELFRFNLSDSYENVPVAAEDQDSTTFAIGEIGRLREHTPAYGPISVCSLSQTPSEDVCIVLSP